MHSRRRGVEADVGHLDPPGARRSVADEEHGLEGGERHRHVGPSPRSRRHVDGQHPRPHGVGRVVLAAEPRAEGGVDHQVARRQHGRRLARRVHRHPHATLLQEGSRRPTVVAVVALAGNDDDPPPVGPTQLPQGGARHRPPCPLDQHLHGLGRGGIDGLHLLGRDDRDHAAAGPNFDDKLSS